MLTADDYTAILLAIETDEPFPLEGEVVFSHTWVGKVYSKGRPRFAKGHAYTPANTRKFEKTLKEWFERYSVEPVWFPCKVEITLYDMIPKSASKKQNWLMENELVYSGVGDVDNRGKSILDAANEVLFVDDKQVIDLQVKRVYDYLSGFRIDVYRAGLSQEEADKLMELKNG